MATKLGKIVADFTSQLATKISVGGTTATLQSATDDDGVALASGRYFFTIDGDNTRKEHISADLSGTALTNIKSISRAGVESTGVAREHRVGATISITDFAHIKYLNDLLDGTTNLNASTPLEYDGTATINADNQLATKDYVDNVAIAGAPDSTTTTKGLVEKATTAEINAGTATGGDGPLSVSPDQLAASIYKTQLPSSDEKAALVGTSGTPSTSNKYVTEADDRVEFSVTQDGSELYAASSAGSDTYAITLSPAPTAYAAGNVYRFKADVANTGACTLNVNALGAKAIKKNVSDDLSTGDIAANQLVSVIYDGTNFQLLSQMPTAAILRTAVSTDTTQYSWLNMPIPMLANAAAELPGWDLEGFFAAENLTEGSGAGFLRWGLSNNGGGAKAYLPGTGSNAQFRFADSKQWRLRFYCNVDNSTNIMAVGLAALGTWANVYTAETDTSTSQVRVVFNSSNIYLANSNGTNYTANSVSGITRTDWNLYDIVYDGTNIYLYVNGVLKATNSTYIPTSTGSISVFMAGSTINQNMEITGMVFSREL